MTKSRKRMLLSSIAMLLVALVALGSATFAWYVSNATVTASTTQAKASTADGLVIRKTTSDTWADSITYTSDGANKSLNPAAFDYTKTTTGTFNGMSAAKGTTESNGAYHEAGTALTTGRTYPSTRRCSPSAAGPERSAQRCSLPLRYPARQP